MFRLFKDLYGRNHEEISATCRMLVLLLVSGRIFFPRFFARVWFDDADACYVKFGERLGGWVRCKNLSSPLPTVPTICPALHPAFEPVFVINLSQEIPVSRSIGTRIFLRYDRPNFSNITRRSYAGTQNDSASTMHPLGPGQSAVQIVAPVYFGHGEYDSGNTWAKDSQIISPDPYVPVSNYTVNVH